MTVRAWCSLCGLTTKTIGEMLDHSEGCQEDVTRALEPVSQPKRRRVYSVSDLDRMIRERQAG